MNEKTPASAPTAKPCPQEFISIPADVADELATIADNARSVLNKYRRSILDGATRDGLWISDENAALDLAAAMAAIDGLGNVIQEFIFVDEPAPAAPKTIQEGSLKFRSYNFQPEPDGRVGLKVLKAAQKRLAVDRILVHANELGRELTPQEELEVRQLRIDAAQVDGDFSGIFPECKATDPSVDPEKVAAERLAAIDAAKRENDLKWLIAGDTAYSLALLSGPRPRMTQPQWAD